MQEMQVWSLGWEDSLAKIPGERDGNLIPGKSHGQKSLAGYSPWGYKELDMTLQLKNSNNNDWGLKYPKKSLWRKGDIFTFISGCILISFLSSFIQKCSFTHMDLTLSPWFFREGCCVWFSYFPLFFLSQMESAISSIYVYWAPFGYQALSQWLAIKRWICYGCLPRVGQSLTV